MNTVNTLQPAKEVVYVDYLNKDNKFKPARKFFNTYEEAKQWCIDNLQSFNNDMLHYTQSF